MWDNASLLRSITNTLMAFSVLAVLYGAVHYVVHLPGLFPLHSVQLETAPQRADAREILQAVRDEVHGNFFTVDIDGVRQALEKLPWVRGVSIRREFPDRLVVQLEEHEALARWNGNALVNRQGEVFNAQSGEALPEFSGPEGTSAEVAQTYAQFSQQLAALNLPVTQIELSARHAWQLCLGNGMVLELGREQMQQRLATFVRVYPYSLAAMPAGGKSAARAPAKPMQAKYVDLRYRNGFAVQWRRSDA